MDRSIESNYNSHVAYTRALEAYCDSLAQPEQHMKPIAWYDPSNGVVSTDKDCPLFTPLGQVWALYPQPDQEPVAWMHEWEDGERIPLMYSSDSRDNDEPVSVRPLVYGDTTPPQRPWVDLSDSQIEQVYYDVAKLHRGAPMPWGQVQFGNALQALIKEKNYD